jgi:hypothetical protein
MSRLPILAGLLVDSWRDQSPQTKPSEMSLPGGASPISRLRGPSGDVPPTPRRTSLIALGAVKWKSHRGELRVELP